MHKQIDQHGRGARATIDAPDAARSAIRPSLRGPEPEAVVETAKIGKTKREKKPARAKVKADPAHVAAARELRDRYLERFNGGWVVPNAKYEVGRTLEGPAASARQIAA